jgi:hypothetical protein
MRNVRFATPTAGKRKAASVATTSLRILLCQRISQTLSGSSAVLI